MKALLAAAALSFAQDTPCPERYQSYFLERAGITRPEWEAMCARGEDPKRYFSDRWLEHEKSSHDRKDAAMVRGFLDIPVEGLAREERNALLAIDPETLPAELQERFRRKKKEIQRYVSGLPTEAKTCSKAQADKVRKKARSLALAGYKEVEWEPCEWLKTTIECTWEEMQEKLPFKLLYECDKDVYRCFLIPQHPVNAYIAAYNGGARTPEELVGTAAFGLGNKVMSCRRGSFDE